MTTHAAWTIGNEWAKVTHHPAKTGWVTTIHSRHSGERTGVKVLTPYAGSCWPAGIDMDGRWNAYYSNGQYLVESVMQMIRETAYGQKNPFRSPGQRIIHSGIEVK